MKTEKMTGAEAFVDILRREGVKVIFGIPGGPLLPLYDALAHQSDIQVILVKHEEAAAYAAFAYARVSGKLGVCMATLGPGATNLLSGMPIAFYDSVPVLAITGQVQTTAYARGAHQESTGWFRTPNQEAMYAPTVKHTATCQDASRLADYVRHSIRIALSGRPGPAHLIIPANLLHQTIDYTPLEPQQYRLTQSAAHDEAAMRDVASRIAAAHYPLILMGERALLPDAGGAAQALAEAFCIPLLADLACKSVVDEHSPMYLGCIGVLGHKAGEKYLKEKCDLLLTVGQTFDEISTLSWDPAYAEMPMLIQLDSDAEEIGKVYPVTVASVGSLPSMLRRLHELLAECPVANLTQRQSVVARLRDQHPLFENHERTSMRVPLLPQRVIDELRAALPDNALILSDSSKWTRWLGRYLPTKRGTFFAAHDYEPMGWAVAGVIGVKLACPDQPVICISGDGAFLMHAMEAATAAAYHLDVTWIVMNDARLGIIYDLQKALYGGKTISTTFENPDYQRFAEAFGLQSRVITEPGQLAESLPQILRQRQPAILDVHFDPDELPPARPRSLLITKAMGLPDPKPGPEVTRALLKVLKEK